jgi:cephalosporin hydroxylase
MRSIVRAALVLAGIAAFTWLGFRLGTLYGNPPLVAPVQAARGNLPGPAANPKNKCPDDYVLKQFQVLWYGSRYTWPMNTFLGIATEQNPLDCWIIQEILFYTKPDYVVECGSFKGGSAALWACYLKEVNKNGRVISIDIEDRMQEARKLPIVKERVEFLVGSSTAPEIVAMVKSRVAGKHVLVVLDSLHTREHVLSELKLYSPLAQKGDFIVVQDTNINGNPVYPEFGPGPSEAVADFLSTTDAFVRDRACERLLMTFCPGGFLKRVK